MNDQSTPSENGSSSVHVGHVRVDLAVLEQDDVLGTPQSSSRNGAWYASPMSLTRKREEKARRAAPQRVMLPPRERGARAPRARVARARRARATRRGGGSRGATSARSARARGRAVRPRSRGSGNDASIVEMRSISSRRVAASLSGRAPRACRASSARRRDAARAISHTGSYARSRASFLSSPARLHENASSRPWITRSPASMPLLADRQRLADREPRLLEELHGVNKSPSQHEHRDRTPPRGLAFESDRACMFETGSTTSLAGRGPQPLTDKRGGAWPAFPARWACRIRARTRAVLRGRRRRGLLCGGGHDASRRSRARTRRAAR